MNSESIIKLRQNITTIMAAVSVAVVAIPAARAAEPDLVSALRDQGAQIVPLGPRGGLAGYLVTPVGGAGYSRASHPPAARGRRDLCAHDLCR